MGSASSSSGGTIIHRPITGGMPMSYYQVVFIAISATVTFFTSSSCGTTPNLRRALAPISPDKPLGDGLERFSGGKRYSGYQFPIEPPYQHGAESSVFIQSKTGTQEERVCSGFISSFHGGEEITAQIVTNHHCFSDRKPSERDETGLILASNPDGKVRASDLDEPPLVKGICNDIVVWLGGEPTIISKYTYDAQCLSGSLRSNSVMDIATFDVAITPELLTALPAPMAISDSSVPPPSESVYMVHYEVKDGVSTRYLTKDCRVGRPFYRFLLAPYEFSVNPLLSGGFGNLLKHSFSHDCPLHPGASGSALISEKTGEVVGLNWGGAVINNSAGRKERDAALSPACIRYFLHGLDADRTHCSLIQ